MNVGTNNVNCMYRGQDSFAKNRYVRNTFRNNRRFHCRFVTFDLTSKINPLLSFMIGYAKVLCNTYDLWKCHRVRRHSIHSFFFVIFGRINRLSCMYYCTGPNRKLGRKTMRFFYEAFIYQIFQSNPFNLSITVSL